MEKDSQNATSTRELELIGRLHTRPHAALCGGLCQHALTSQSTASVPPTAQPSAQPLATAVPALATLTPIPTLVAGLAGLWKGDNGSFYLFKVDGVWNWHEHQERVATAPENRGKWWMEGNTFQVVDLSGKEPCPKGQIGHYQMHLEGDTLILRLIKDPCGVRIPQTAGTYRRLPEGSS